MPSTFLDLATDALQAIGQAGDGQSISPEQSQQALRVANRMFGKWSVRRLLLFTINTRPFVLSPTVQDYTLGSVGATFTGPRPTFVEAAIAVTPGTQMENPMNVLNKQQWGAIRDKGAMTSALGTPSDIWAEPTYPNLTFHVWPVPQSPLTIKLGTWEQLQQLSTIFDVLAFPPGYEEAIIANLEMELTLYYDMPVSPALAQLAADGLLAIQEINAKNLGSAFGESRTLQNPNLDAPVPSGGAPQGQ